MNLESPLQKMRLGKPSSKCHVVKLLVLMPSQQEGGRPKIIQQLTHLFQDIWKDEQLPQELKDAAIVHIYKREGKPSVL